MPERTMPLQRRGRSRMAAALTVGVTGITLALMLTSCSAGTSVTVGPQSIDSTDFAAQVADLLAKQVGNGVTPTITCPDEPIPIVDGTVIHCDLTTADSPGVAYDTTTTISNAHGVDFHIDTKVASEPEAK